MAVFFCIPPVSSLTPYPAIPYLTSSLRQNKHVVQVYDLNILAFNTTLANLGYSIKPNELWFTGKGDSNTPIKVPLVEIRSAMDEINQCFEYSMLEGVCSHLGIPNTIQNEIWEIDHSENLSSLAQGTCNNRNLRLSIISDVWLQVSRWIDEVCENFRGPNIVGFHVISLTGQLWGILLSREIKARRPDFLTVLGGPALTNWKDILRTNPDVSVVVMGDGGIPTALVDRNGQVACSAVDVIVIGEGEETIVEVADKYDGTLESIVQIPGISFQDKDKGIINIPRRSLIHPLDKLPFPDYSDLSLTQYPQHRFGVPLMPIVGSRGCIAKCTFCGEWRLWGGKFRSRTSENIVEEIKGLQRLYGARYIRFNDSLLNGDIRILESFCDLLIKENVNIEWMGNARIRPQMTSKLLKKMYQAGCRALWYGLESGSPNILAKMRKDITLETVSNVIRNTSETGISVLTFIIVDFPGETEEDFQQTVDFVIQNRYFIDVVHVSQFALLLGSDIHQNPNGFGVKIHYDEFKFGRKYRIEPKPDIKRFNTLRSVWEQNGNPKGKFPFMPIIPSI